MRFITPVSAEEIARITGSKLLVFENTTQVSGINEIHMVEEGDIVFVDHPKYYDKALRSKASFVIMDQEPNDNFGKTLFIHPKPFEAFNQIISIYKPFQATNYLQNPQAIIGKNTIIQPNVFIGPNVSIGDNCVIHPNVVLYGDISIGNHVIIHANTVIGSDAFYYNKKTGVYQKFLSCGNVIIHDRVEIGASCTIDRGVTGSTIIGEGTKLDNQVHIGHDTEIGKNCLFAAQVGIAGVCKIKDGVTLWGQVGVSSKITIEENATVLAQSGVSKSLKANTSYFGSPAGENSTKLRELAVVRGLVKNNKK